jgi:5-methylcytosine-specific restriction endonuclease McrA
MKICWDNLERLNVSKEGNFRIDKNIYIEMEACEVCGESYLAKKGELGLFCSNTCANSKENNNMYGKIHSAETRKKMSKPRPTAAGHLAPNYKGGVVKLGLTTYVGYKDSLGIYEDAREQSGTKTLEVKCTYCGRWFPPTRRAVDSRLWAINNLARGECRLYCSENCKQACPTYNRKMYPKGFKHTTSREVSTYLRQMVLERDNWTCQICGKTIKEVQLHVHHTDPVRQHPMFQNDMDSCITLCKGCHKMVHSVKGCRYVDLQCKKEIITVEDRNKPMLY